MIPARSSTDKFRSAFSGFRGFQLLALLGATALPLSAEAQATDSPATGGAPATVEAPPAPAPVPSAPVARVETPPPTSPIEPAEPVLHAAATSPAPATESVAEPRKKKKHKKKHKSAAERDDNPGATEPQSDELLRDETATKDDKVAKAAKHDLRLKGRIFVLGELSHRRETVVGSTGALEERNRDALDLWLRSARVGLDYRSPLRFLRAQVEIEATRKPRLKDAYLQAGKKFFVKAGQFKLPSPALEQHSSWHLPLARRGMLHDLMTDWLDIAGRAPGVAVGYHGRSKLKLRLTLGAFQGSTLKQVVPGDRDVKLIDHASLTAQTYAARAQMSLASVQIGAWYEQRVGSIETGAYSHFATFGLDAGLSQKLGGGTLRVWLDASGGESLYVNADKPGDDPYPWFAAGRALVGYRFGGEGFAQSYVEPFGFLALLDPDTQVVSDFVSEAAVGVAVGFWEHARLTLQAEMTDGQRNFPNGFLDNQNPDHMSLVLLAGASF
jgi:hypothetical protein